VPSILPGSDPAILVDAGRRDDAAVVRPESGRALVLTTDFFTPIVDDPYTFGCIAAANALSDVYAMGGRPRWCLNLVGWPRDRLPLEALGEVLRGGAEVVAEARALIVGGHSIDDPEPKYGLMVVGEVDPERMTTNAAARAGDRLAASGVGAEIWAGSVPRLPGARRLAQAGHVPGGTMRNLESAETFTEWDGGLDAVERLLLADAQTSGGLLLAVHPEALPRLLAALAAHQAPAAAEIGVVTPGAPGRIAVRAIRPVL